MLGTAQSGRKSGGEFGLGRAVESDSQPEALHAINQNRAILLNLRKGLPLLVESTYAGRMRRQPSIRRRMIVKARPPCRKNAGEGSPPTPALVTP